MHPEIERLIRERQDLAPILKLYQLILEKQELSQPDDLSQLIDFKKDVIKEKLKNNIPLIDPSKTDLLDLQNSVSLFFAMLEIIKEGSDQLRRLIDDILARTGRVNAEEAMKIILDGDQEELKRLADRLELSDDLLFFLARLSLAPSLKVLSSRIKGNLEEGWWSESFCPLCGQLPNLAEINENGKRLSCSFCWTEWLYVVSGCPFCGTDDKKMAGALRIKGEEGYYLSICGNCNGYIKIIDRRLLPKELDSRIIDLISLPLDIIARQKGHKGTLPFPI